MNDTTIFPEFPETPIQLSCSTASGNRLYYKRDDLLPFSFGGNKVRIAAEYFRDMRKKGATCMIGYGNIRSNLSRALSWMANRFGFPCYLISPEDDPDTDKAFTDTGKTLTDIGKPFTEIGKTLTDTDMTFNRQLSLLSGASVIPCQKTNVASCVKETVSRLRDKGEIPYYIYGNAFGEGNENIPLPAYIGVFDELSRQTSAMNIAPDYLFLACGTGSTLAGLLYGKYLKKSSLKIIGISVARDRDKASSVTRQMLNRYGEKTGAPAPQDWIDNNLFIEDGYTAGGYGKYNPEILSCIRAALTRDGVPLDPTYTGKAFWGMNEFLGRHHIEGKTVMFLHTGGLPLFFDLLSDLS